MNIIEHLKKLLKSMTSGYTNNQKGVVLPIVLMAIGGLSLIGAAAVGVATGEIGIANNDKIYKTAINLAEAGVADAGDGLQGNRDMLPKPLGSINATSYSFNTALGASGRYNVTITLPVVTTLTSAAVTGASSVVVADTSNLAVGDTIVLGNTTTHMMTKIGSISGSTLNLTDGKGNPYSLLADLASGDYVARNLIRVTSEGQAGSNLSGTYSLAAWRAVSTVNGALNPALPSGGTIRSTAKVQAEYTLQEIEVFDQFSADVTTSGNKFNGPILVTTSLDVTQANYKTGDYSGPIFRTTGATVTFNNLTLPSTTPNNYPKVVTIPTAKVNVDTLLTTAASNAACFQKACGVTGANQQIYYLNGYQIDVLDYRPGTNGSPNFPISIGNNYSYDSTYLYFTMNVDTTFMMNSNDNLTVNLNTTTSPTTANMGSGGNIAQTAVTLVSTTDNHISLNGGNITFANNQTYTAGTTATIRIALSALPNGTYLRLYDNSSNMPGFSNSEVWSNGIWVSSNGGVTSSAKQGDVTTYTDSGAGTHTNHSIIQPADPEPTVYYKGIYGTSETASSTTTAWIAKSNDQRGPLLFGGRLKNSTAWKVGDRAEYNTTYYIHTNAVGSCNDHDIQIVSRTKVTYLGISTQCGENEQKKLFLYETIWNHGSDNTLNRISGVNSVQADDSDPQLGVIPHKGYYKWVRAVKSSEAKLFTGGEQLMGDQEFVSVFNHSANTAFHSAVVNVNIEKVRMVGWANPPMAYSGATMNVTPQSFAVTGFKMPANSSTWDWPDMVGTRSGFVNTAQANGFDFTGFSTTVGNIIPYTIGGNKVLPDMSAINAATASGAATPTGTGNVTKYRNTTGTWPGVWVSDGTVAMPGNPLLDPNALPATTITATISGPNFTTFEVKRGSANLFFNAANGVPFNIKELKIETKGAGAGITIGSAANPATVFAGEIQLESEDCGGTINFNFTGKMVASEVKLENSVQYTIDTTISPAGSCLAPATQSFIYLRKTSWKELR